MENTFCSVRWVDDRITNYSKSHIVKEVTSNNTYVALCGVRIMESITNKRCIEIENGDHGSGNCQRCLDIYLKNPEV